MGARLVHQDKAFTFHQFGRAGLEIATNRVADMHKPFFSFVTKKLYLDVKL